MGDERWGEGDSGHEESEWNEVGKSQLITYVLVMLNTIPDVA